MPHYRGRVQSTPVPERFRPLLSATAELAERFTKAHRTLYLVGGSVRDALFPPARRPSATSISPPTPGPTRSSAWSVAGPPTCGRREPVSAPSAAGATARSSRSPRTGPRSTCRLAQARGDLRERHRAGPVAARLHHQRDGPAPARHGVGGPLRRAGRSGGGSTAHPARSRDLLRRRPAAHAARGPLHGPLLAQARSGAGGGRRVHARAAVDRLARADPRRAGQDRRPRRALRGAVVRGAHRPGRGLPARAARAWRSSRTPSTATRTCWRTRWPWWTRRHRTGCSGSPRSSTMWASRARGPSPTAG